MKRRYIWLCLAMALLMPLLVYGAALRQGDRGEEVTALQKKLRQWGYYDGTVDGIFGSGTLEAVKKFQRKNGLDADGIVGEKTAAALGMQLSGSGSSGSVSSSENSNINLLAQCINGEARGESYKGQVAVGAVILNRVEHPSFPDTLSGVIYQPGAFTAITDGQFNESVAESAYRAARDALNGTDPSGGAIYYYNPDRAINQWIRSRPVIKRIGKHLFCS